jgi:uncharacterized damage-inducible protein DinB
MPAWISTSNERDALNGFLDNQRDALIRKVQGVSDEDARRRVTVSSLTLLGLLNHSTTWEQRWFQGVFAGQDLPDGWPAGDQDAEPQDFVVDERDTVEDWTDRYLAAAEQSRRIAAANDLDTPAARPEIVDCNLRYVLIHMIEETARHAGHADIIRETIDGIRGL